MAYLVKITARAERDLAALFEDIHAEQSDAALEWYRGLKKTILALEAQPNRCPVKRERARLRHLLYGHKPHVYRVIYRVAHKQNQVEILHVLRGARKRFVAREIR